MGVALYLVWREGFDRPDVKVAMAIFGVQLVLNVGWSWAFFGLQSPLAGMIVIGLLWAAILAAILYFYRVSRAAALLLIPYITWVTIAASLNISIWMLNP